MDLKEARIVLKKINSLFESIDYEGSRVSDIERELMMNYLDQMHTLFNESKNKPSLSREAPAGKPESRSLSDNRPTEQEPPQEKAPAPKKEAEPPAVKKRLIQDYPPRPRREDPEPKTEQQPLRQETPPPPPPPVERHHEESSDIPVQKLFEVRQATDLSEKLSESPVNDLNRALSINDRLLYMNELFGRDMETLNQSLQILNNYSNMQEAKQFLTNIAEQHDWTNEDRIDIAKSFIKLVRRRYQ